MYNVRPDPIRCSEPWSPAFSVTVEKTRSEEWPGWSVTESKEKVPQISPDFTALHLGYSLVSIQMNAIVDVKR